MQDSQNRLIQKGVLISILCWILFSEGCASTQPEIAPSLIPSPEISSTSFSPTTSISKMPPGIANSIPYVATEDYSIGTGDVLDIKIYGMDDLNRQVRVGADGNITLPLIGWVAASGLNASELESQIAARYSEKYLQDPQVAVYIKEFRSKRVTVLGQVKNPQVLQLSRNRSTLLEVISLCGGIQDEVGEFIYVIKPATEDSQEEVITVNVSELIKYKNPLVNKEMIPGDVVIVPPVTFYYIVGEVDKPGAYALKPDMNILQAISQGGKFSKTAKRKIRIMRDDPEHGIYIFKTVDVKRVEKGKDENILVQGGDVLLVGESSMRRVVAEVGGFSKGIANAFMYAYAYEFARR